MTTPSWMPPAPDLPYCEGSADGDLAPSDLYRWANDYALAAVEAYKQTPEARRDRAIAQAVEDYGATFGRPMDMKWIMRRADELLERR